ncbi:MAG: class I SAM-dependent methyltransferase [Halanaerobiaceae bacterium]
MSREYFNTVAASWDEKVDHNRRKIKEMMVHFPDISSPGILDVGTGTGIMIPFLKSRYPRASIIGIDFAENMIEQARGKYGTLEKTEFEVADIYDCHYREQFDLITVYSVFPHLRQRKTILQLFFEYLQQDGFLIIFHSQSRREINNLHSRSGEEVARDRLPPAVELKEAFCRAGFSPQRVIDGNDRYFIMGKKS